MEENKNNQVNSDSGANIASFEGLAAGPQHSTVPEMVGASVDPGSVPVMGVDVAPGPDQTAVQHVPVCNGQKEPEYAHDEDGLPVQNGWAVLAHPPHQTPEDRLKEREEKTSDNEPGKECFPVTPPAHQTHEEVDKYRDMFPNQESGAEGASSSEAGGGSEQNEPTPEQEAGPQDGPAEPDNGEEQPKQLIENPDDPLNGATEQQIQAMLKQVQEMVRIMESQWMSSKKEFELTESHMKMLYKFNEDNRDEMPEGLTDEEKDKWDHFNGLSKLTEQDVVNIFGEGHKIIGIEHTITLDRIRDVVNDFFSWTYAMREYRNIHDAYLQLIYIEEEKNIKEL